MSTPHLTQLHTQDVYLPLLPVYDTDAVNKFYADNIGDTYGTNFFQVTESYSSFLPVSSLAVSNQYGTNGYNPFSPSQSTWQSTPNNILRKFNSVNFTSNTFATLCALSASFSYIQLQPGIYHITAESSLQNAGSHCTSLIAFQGQPGFVTEIFTTVQGQTPWTLPPSVSSFNVLIVGGGGGGGNSTGTYTGAGGGGGGVTYVSGITAAPGSVHYITVGAGGEPGSNGSTSFFDSYYALGGFGGATATQSGPGPGGDSGGLSFGSANSITYNSGLSGGIAVGNYGGAGAGKSYLAPQGSTPGVYPVPTLTAGQGYYSSDIQAIVAGGGGSAIVPVPTNIINYGFGGNGGSFQADGGSGGKGAVVISYHQNIHNNIPFSACSTDLTATLYIGCANCDGDAGGGSYNRLQALGRFNSLTSENFGGQLTHPPGLYRVYYKSGAFKYNGSFASSYYGCNLVYSDGKSDVYIGGGLNSGTYAQAEAAGKNFNGTGIPWYIDIYHTGGAMGIYLADSPYDDNRSDPTNGEPVWALQQLDAPLPQNASLVACGTLAYSTSAWNSRDSSSTSYLTTRLNLTTTTNIVLMHAFNNGGGKPNDQTNSQAVRLGALPIAYEGITSSSLISTYQPKITTAEMKIWQIGTASTVTQVSDGVGDDRTGINLNF